MQDVNTSTIQDVNTTFPIEDIITSADVEADDEDKGLTRFQTYATILLSLAFVCLILGLINLYLHFLGKRRRVPFRGDHPALHTVSSAVAGRQGGHHGGQVMMFSKMGGRSKSVHSNKSRGTSVQGRARNR